MNGEYTVKSLSSRRKDPAVIFSMFNLRASKYGEKVVYCFVEGYDMPYYQAPIKNLLNKKVVNLECGGKANVLSVNNYIEQKKEYKHYIKRYFVDRDYTNNEEIPNSVWITDGYAIENYYLYDSCLSHILDIEFKTNEFESPEVFKKCMKLFHSEHQAFEDAILLFNAWYCCIMNNPTWDRNNVRLKDKFPDEWINLNIGNIIANYTMEDIEKKYPFVPKVSKEEIEAKKDYLRKKGWRYMRGHYEMEFLFKFLSFLKDEPKGTRTYTIKSCSIQFNHKTMLSTFSQYAYVSDSLKNYIRTGHR